MAARSTTGIDHDHGSRKIMNTVSAQSQHPTTRIQCTRRRDSMLDFFCGRGQYLCRYRDIPDAHKSTAFH